jgi:ketosteroid isomerase-like protein
MSTDQETENRRIVQRIYDAANSGDVATIQSLLDPDIVLHQASTLPHGGEFRGLEAAMAGIGRMFETLDLSEIKVHQLAVSGDLVVAAVTLLGRLRPSGAPLDMQVRECFRLRNGKVYELQPFYFDTGALAAAAAR